MEEIIKICIISELIFKETINFGKMRGDQIWRQIIWLWNKLNSQV